ncbi:hypothetical protein [Jatrophihabitans sp.]|jgi:hypothetical protein|uniref:hypothetical protein n=1 Tax=Jatrophihabitans sp. TaxID=1932789 RepID=UPI002F1257A5
MTVTLCDVSEYQPHYSSAYPRDAVSFRVDNGWRLDYKAITNWARIQPDLDSGRLAFALAYVVLIPGQEAAIVARIKTVLGPVPNVRLAFMVDVESGPYFAGPGDHSGSANELAGILATYARSSERVAGYANSGDWANCWPRPPAWLKRFTAEYSSSNPGSWGWQYTDGTDTWPVPAGWPRDTAPFGRCDHNVINRTLAQAVADLGVAPPKPPAPPAPSPGGATTRRRRNRMLFLVQVDSKECERAKLRWPGWFICDGFSLTHVSTPADRAALATVMTTAKKPISIAQYKSLGGAVA